MENNFKRFLSLLLAVVMVIGMFPVGYAQATIYSDSKSSWTSLGVDTEHREDGKLTTEGPFELAWDGNTNTIWHSNYVSGSVDKVENGKTYAGYIDFGAEQNINWFSFKPRTNSENGRITKASLYVGTPVAGSTSNDPEEAFEWTPLAEHQEFASDMVRKVIFFDEQPVRYVKFLVEGTNNGFICVSEFDIGLSLRAYVSGTASDEVGDFDKSVISISDGSNATFWASPVDGSVADKYLIVDLGEEKLISGVKYTGRYSNGWSCTGNLLDYEIRVSNNIDSWGDPIATGDVSNGVADISFEKPVRTRYIKLTATQSHHWQAENENKAMCVGEFEVFEYDCVDHKYTDDCDSDCDICGENRTAPHSWSDATCTAPKTCSLCKKTEGSKLGHRDTQIVVVKEPTLCEYGTYETFCNDCNTTISDDNAITQLPVASIVNGDKLVALSDCEYTLQGDSNGQYSLSHDGIYVKPGANGAAIPQSTNVCTTLYLFWQAENDAVHISDYTSGGLHFWSTVNNTNKNYWDRCSGSFTGGNDNSADRAHDLYLFRANGTGTGNEIPGYTKVTADDVKSGESYLIAGKCDGKWYVMHPAATSTKYDHIAEVTGMKQITGHTADDDGNCTTAVLCSVCGVEVVAANTHSFDNDCTTGDKCANCDVVADKAEAHTWDSGTQTAAPGCGTTGEMVYKCTVDGCTGSKTETVDALGHNWGTDGMAKDCQNNCGASNPAIIDTAEELQNALNAGGEVKLEGSINASSGLVVPENVTVVLNLNGYNISRWSGYWYESAINNKGNLTIEGNGEIVGEGQTTAVINDGVLVINGGTYDAYQSSLYIRAGSAVINGGYFRRSGNQGAINAGSNSLTITGGTFNSELTDVVGEKFITGGTFAYEVNANYLAEGYCVGNQNDMYTVQQHSYSKTVVKPTCTDAGYTTYVCSFCNHTYTGETVKATDHAWTNDCDTICDNNCGYTRTIEHQWDEGVQTTAPDCVNEGVMTYTCGICDDKKTAAIEALDHTPADAVRENVKNATCYAEGSYDEVVYCAVAGCGEQISRTTKSIEKIAHTPSAPVRENVQDSTCKAEGSYDEVVYCAVAECRHVITRNSKTIAMKDHVWANACDTDCNNCGQTRQIQHTFELNGVDNTVEKCEICGAVNPDYVAVYAAQIGEEKYETLAEALAAASAMTGDVVVEVYDKVTLNTALSGSYDSIKFVGKDSDAEIYLDVQGYITATGKKVAFEALTLSKSSGGYVGNAGFMNVAFGVYDVAEVTYTNCTFANGACASSGKVSYNGCTFYRSHDKYGLWAYGDVDVTVEGCTFADYRGIKMYAEGGAKTVNLTVRNTDFSAVTDKPAIVLTYGESVTLEGNIYSGTGVFELDLDGAPNGTPVTSDVAPTCKNDNGACGVLVDGKIYTTAAQAAEVAVSGSKVVLLHDSQETVEFAEGVELDRNGFTAAGVTVKVPVYVAQIGDKKFETLAEAVAEAQAGDVIRVLEGEFSFDENAASIVVDKAVTIQGAGKGNTKLIFNSAASAFVVKSSGVTIKDMTIEQGSKDNSFAISIDKGAWDAPAIAYSNVTIKNVAFVGGDYALCLIGENVTVDSCSFTDQDSHNIIIYSVKGDSKITNNVFNASKGSNKSAILFEGGADNATDLTGFIGGGKLTIDGNTANAKGVFFQFTNWKLVKGMELAITDNKVDAFTNKAIALYDMDGAVTVNGDEFASVVVKENVFTNIPSGRPVLREYTGTVNVDASANYLGSAEPDVAALVVGAKTTVDSYYQDEAKTILVRIARGTVTPSFTAVDSIWGETRNNASESMVITLYEGDKAIATASLNNVGGIIDGDVYVTWRIPFAGSTDEYWNVQWAEGYPNINMVPTKVTLTVDDTMVDENNHQFNGPDNLNPIVALAEGEGKLIGAYMTVSAAVAAGADAITLVRDTNEQIVLPAGVTLNTNGHNAPNVTVAKAMIGNVGYASVQAAIDAAVEMSGDVTITVLAGTHTEDISLTNTAVTAGNANARPNITFVGAEGAVLAGTVTVGYRQQNVGASTWNGNVTFQSITFDHAESGKHSLDIQDVKGIFLNDCVLNGDGEYGIGSASGNSTTNAKFTGCTFNNGAMQVLGQVGANLVVENCTMNDFNFNVQGGAAPGMTITGSTFNMTLTDAHVGESFYAIRTNACPVNIEGTTFNVDSTVTGTAADQAKWAILWARKDSNAKWVVNNCVVNLTAAAMAQSELLLTKNEAGEANGKDRMVITNLTSASNDVAELIARGEGYATINGTKYLDGKLDLSEMVAKIGDNYYATLEAAAAAAQSGDEIVLLSDVTLSAELTLPAGVIFNGNGKQINGTVYAGGDLTFKGHTKVTAFSATYYDRTITIGEGACLEVTGTGRVTLGYGNTFHITGSIENAKTADKTAVQPSLIIPGGISITGGNDAAMNVTNAYVKIGNTSSKNSAANGTFTLNFTNSIAEFTNQFTLAEPTSGKNPTFNVNVKDSVLTTATKLCVAAPNSTVVIDNSVVTLGSYLRNSGELTLVNGSELTGSMIQFGENGGNDGTITVDASELTIKNSNTAHAMDGNGTGKLILKNGGNASVDYIIETAVHLGAGSTLTCKTEGLAITTDEGCEVSDKKVEDGYTVYESKKLPVAKVGNTEYGYIEDALAAWTNGTTLTLLADVTLPDVVKLKSTEHHILDLGTYTLTAASGKNAIEITCEGRTSASYALTVNADAENPGGITATGKACIYYSKSGSTKDRPIIRIYNGVFNGSYSINSKSNGNTNCPQIWIYGGTFNGNVNLTKNMLRVFGGTFNGWINCTGDSSAYREISGGRFKSWQFMTADAPNKFWVGTSQANYNVGVYVDDEGYLVVGGDVITEPGEKFEASSTNYGGWSSYLKYSSAAENSLYYTSVEEALADNNKTTGAVTIYTDALDLTSLNYKGTLYIEDTLTVTFAEGTTPAWTVAPVTEGEQVAYTDTVENGVVTRSYRTFVPAAKIGNTYYETVAAALADAQSKGMTEVTIVLVGENTKESAMALEDSFNLIYQTAFDKVTLQQEDASKPYYIDSIYTGSRSNGGAFVFDGVNIVVTGQYMFEGNVTLSNNSLIKSVAEANCFFYYSNTTIEPGSKLYGVIEDFRGGNVTVDGGKTDGTYSTEPDMQDAIMIINWSGDKLVLKNGAYVKINSANEVGRLIVNAGTSIEMSASRLDAYQWIAVNGTLQLDAKSSVTTKQITGSGKIVIDAAGLTAGEVAFISGDLSGFTGTVEVINNNDLYAEVVDGKIVLKSYIAKIGEKGYTTLEEAVAAAQNGETVVLLADVALTEPLTVARSITIDGNGHTITPADSTKTYNSAIMVGDSGWGDDHGESITLKNIKFNGWNTNYGVVRAQGVTLNVENCEFNENAVSNVAYGVLSLNFTDATVTGSKFVENTSRAIDINYNGDGSNAIVTIDGCTFEKNTSTGAGIVVRNDGEKLVVKNSTFKDNTVNTNGNAATLYAGWGSADEVTGNTFEGNTVTTSHATTKRFASAIFCDGCTVNGNVFGEGNTATRNGESVSTIVAVGAYYGAADIGENYWGGEAPVPGVDYTIEYTRNDVAVEDYYTDPELTNLVSTGYVAKVDKYGYTSLQEAFKAAKSGSVITLLDDVTITENWDCRYTGSKFTVPVTIDGNGKTIKFTGTVNDSNYFAAFRFEADATVRNLTVDMSEAVGTSNRFRAISAKANLTVENCTFIGNPAVTNTRAIIFGEGSGAANVGNVTVSVTGSTFVNWKRGLGDNENAQNAKSVTASGNTFTNAGANISAAEEIVFTDNTINGGEVVITSYNDLIDSVTVTGNTLNDGAVGEVRNAVSYDNIQEEFAIGAPAAVVSGNTTKYFNSLADAFAAAEDGNEVLIRKAGTYALSTSGKDITITATVDGVVFDNIGAKNMGGANVIFKNVTFDYYPNVNYTGLQHAGTISYSNCTFNGQVFLYGNAERFDECIFNQNSADAYNVWTYGAADVWFNNCTFNSAGKSVLIYKENDPTFVTDVRVSECTFTASSPVDGKAAIELDSSLIGGISLTIEETTATGFGTGNVSGNSLWNNKKGDEGVNNDITVSVDGVVVLNPVKNFEVNGVYYRTLDAAYAAAKVGETVKLLTDVELSEILVLDKAITLDGNRHKLTSTAERAINVNCAGKVTIKDLTIATGNANMRAAAQTERAINVINQAAELTLDNVTAEGFKYTVNVAASSVGSEITINGGKFSGYAALNITGNDTKVTVSNAELVGLNNVSYDESNAFAAIAIGNTSAAVSGVEVTVNGGKITTASTNGNIQAILQVHGAAGAKVTLDAELELCEGVVVNGGDINNATIAVRSEYTDALEAQGYAVTAPVNGLVTIDGIAVASCNGVSYASLQAAIDAAQNGDTVKLLTDCAENVTVVQAPDKVITIDGSGRTMTGYVTVDGRSAAYATAGLTIQNVNFVAPDVKDYACIRLGGSNSIRYTSNVTVTGCNFTGTEQTAAIKNYTGGCKNLTVTGCTSTGMHSLIQVKGVAGLTVSDVTVSGKNGIAVGTSTNVVIDNATITATGYGVRADGSDAYKLTVKNSTINAELPIVVRKNTGAGFALTLEDNSLTASNENGHQVIITAGDDGTYETPAVPAVLSGTENLNVFPAYAARIGALSYPTFAEAYAAAEAGQTIELLAPITVAAGETLELSKAVIVTYTSDVMGEAMITNNGELTLTDVKVIYTYTGAADSNYGKGNYTIANNGKLTIDGGAAVENATAQMKHASYAITNGNGGEIILNNGLVVNTNNYAVRMFGNGSLTVNGGEIKGTRAVWMQAPSTDAAVAPTISLTVNGGKLTGTGESADYKLAVYSYTYGNSLENVSITVNGGEIDGDIALTGGKNKNAAEKVTVTGGKLTSLYSYAADEVAGKTINISGGTFIKCMAEVYCAEGYIPVKNSDGTYGVKLGAITVRNTTTGFGYETLAGALADCSAGENVIVLLTDNAENVTVKQAEGVNVTIDGDGNAFSGTITIHGNARYTGEETLTIQNMEFVTNKEGHYFIDSNSTASAERYAHNVTVKDSYFTATGKARNTAAAMRIRQGFNISIENVQATGMHSVLQAYGTAGIKVSGLTVNDGKNGLSVGTSTNVLIENVNISGTGYGIRADGTGAYDMTVKNVTIKAADPIVIRKNTAAGYKLTMEGTNVLSGNANGYQVIFTAGDDGTYEAPAVSAVLSGTENLNVFPAFQARIGENYYATLAAAVAAAEAGNTIEMLADAELTEALLIGKSITINGNGHKVTSAATRVFRVSASEVEVTLNDVNMVSNAVRVGTNDIRGISIDAGLSNVKLTLNNCSVDFTDSSTNDWTYAVNVSGNGTGHTLTVNGGTFEGANVINVHGASNTVVVKDAVLTSLYPNHDVYFGSAIWVLQENGSSVEATGNTFNGPNAVAFNVGTGTAVTESGNTDNTTMCMAKIGETYYTSLAAAVAAAKTGETVKLLHGTDEDLELAKAISLEVNGQNYTGTVTLTDLTGALTAPEGLDVITNLGEDYKVVYEEGTYKVISKTYVAQIEGGASYETLAAAIAAAKAGNTIVLLADVAENVTVSKSLTINGANFEYTGNISVSGSSSAVTVKNVNFVDGTAYAITTNRIASITVENCTVKNYGYGFLYANKSTTTVVVRDVTVDGGNYGVHWVYGGTATLENVKMTNVYYGLYIQNYASKTVTLKNCDISSIAIWERTDNSGVPYTGVQTFKFEGANTVGTLTDSQYAKYVLTAEGATLTAPEGFNVTTDVDGYEVEYFDGAYHAVEIVRVARIGETQYKTLAAAIAAAKAGDVIELLADVNENVTVNKNLTINGAGKNYTGKMTANKVNLTVENLNFVQGTIYKNKNTGNGGNFVIRNCTFDGQGLNDYAVNLGGTSTIVIEDVTAENYGYGFLQVPSSTSSLSVKDVQISNVNYGLKVDYAGSVTLENVTVENAAVAGLLDSNYGAKTYTIIDSNINYIDIWDRNETTYSTFLFEGENSVAKLPESAFAKLVLAENATLAAPEGFNVTTNLGEDYKVVYENGMYQVKAKQYVAQTADGKKFEKLSEAITAASADTTVTLLANVTEDVTVSKSLTINGANFEYTGNISVSGSSSAVTVKNVNFVDGTAYAITTNRIASITVENCTVKNYGYGFLYANKSTTTVVVRDVTVDGGNYGVHWVYGGTATLENVKMTNVTYGLYIQNYASKTVTMKDCDISSIAIWERTDNSGVPYTGVQTFKFEGANTVGTLTDSQYAKYVLTAEGATLTAPEGFNVTTTVVGCDVAYENGAYRLVPKAYVAENGENKYETIQEAVNAAADGDVITILRDHTIGTAVQNEENYGYETLIIVDGKSITIDFAGHTVTVEYTDPALYPDGVKNGLEAAIFVYADAALTLTDSTEGAKGGITMPADENVAVYSMFYNCGGKLTIVNGTYNLVQGHAAASLIYAEDDHTTSIENGYFTVGNAGTDGAKPWIFNTEGKNATFITVTGGTFNQDPYMNKGTAKDCEVDIPYTKAIRNNNDGTWTIVDAVCYDPATEIGYATIADAAEEAKKIVMLTNATESLVLVPAGVTLDLNGKVVKADNVLSFGIVMDSADEVGGIEISNDTTKAFVKLQPENGGYLPIYDIKEGEEIGIYKFFKHTVVGYDYQIPAEGQIKFRFRLLFDNHEAYNVLSSTAAPGIDYVLTLSWTGMNGFKILYRVSDEQVQSTAGKAYDQVMSIGENKKVMTLTIYGIDSLQSGAEITATPGVSGMTEVTSTGETIRYTIP